MPGSAGDQRIWSGKFMLPSFSRSSRACQPGAKCRSGRVEPRGLTRTVPPRVPSNPLRFVRDAKLVRLVQAARARGEAVGAGRDRGPVCRPGCRRRVQLELAWVPGTLNQSCAKQVGDHDQRDPGFAAERAPRKSPGRSPANNRLIRQEDEPGELRNLGEIMARLRRRGRSVLEGFLPEGAKRFVVVGGKCRNRDALIRASRDRAMGGIDFPHCGILNPAIPNDCKLGRT